VETTERTGVMELDEGTEPNGAPADQASSPDRPYSSRNKIRIVTAAALFDGHDAAINIMRRILQASGAEVIHLGHDRSVDEVVDCAIRGPDQETPVTVQRERGVPGTLSTGSRVQLWPHSSR
jgi:hypothetical protein